MNCADETTTPVPPALAAACWAIANGASTETRLVVLILVAAADPAAPPAAWTPDALAIVSGLHPAAVGEALRFLRRHRAVQVCRRMDGDRVVFAALDVLTGHPAPAPQQAAPAPAIGAGRPSRWG